MPNIVLIIFLQNIILVRNDLIVNRRRIFLLSRSTLELSERTNIKLYTTSIDGTRHFWAANGSFGEYASKQYHFSNAYKKFVCAHNVTIQRYKDLPLRNIYKRLEFLYELQIAGYRREFAYFKEGATLYLLTQYFFFYRTKYGVSQTLHSPECEICN